jgi:hypothetical protein
MVEYKSGVRGKEFACLFKKRGIIFMFCIPDSKGFMEACTIPDHRCPWSHLHERVRKE